MPIFGRVLKLLVLSEVYYPKGWRAYIDGKRVRIYKTNYILRSISVPAGRHEIRFVFQPSDFKWGLRISATAFVVLVGLLVVGGFKERRAKKRSK